MKPLSSNRGNTMIMVMVAFTAMGFTVLSMNQYLGTFNKLRKDSTTKMGARVVVSSAMAQMAHLLKMGVVIDTSTLSPAANQPADFDAWATDENNLGRLVMPTAQLPYINSRIGRSVNDETIIIKDFKGVDGFTTGNLSNLPVTNPLRYVLQQVPGIDTITFKIHRMGDEQDGDMHYPVSEATVFVRITATVNGTGYVFTNRALLTGTSVFAISPRELNQYAFMGGIADMASSVGTAQAEAGQLVFGSVVNPAASAITARDTALANRDQAQLDLGADPSNATKIAALATAEAALTAAEAAVVTASATPSALGTGGVHFYGKTIFHEVRLPARNRLSAADFGEQVTTYSPPKQPNAGGTLDFFRPASAGGVGSALLAEIPGVSFRGGIRMDVEDPGLKYLFKMDPNTATTNVAFCSAYASSFLDVADTQNTSFAIINGTPAHSGSGTGAMQSHYRLAWDGYNAIMDQSTSARAVSCPNVTGGNCALEPRLVSVTPDAVSALPSLKINLTLTTSSGTATNIHILAARRDQVIFELMKDAEMTISALDAEILALNNQITAANAALGPLVTAVTTASTDRDDKLILRDAAQTALNAAPGDQALIDDLALKNTALTQAEADLTTAQDALNSGGGSARDALVASRDSKVAERATAVAFVAANPHNPRLTIETSELTVGSDVQVNQMKLNVSTTHWELSGLSLEISITSGEKGSDGSFGTVRTSPLNSNSISMNFTNATGTGLTPPSYASFNTTGTPVNTSVIPTFPADNYNLEADVVDCESISTAINSFVDYSPVARTESWAATHKPAQNVTITYDGTNASLTPVPVTQSYTFPFYSIVSRVLIKKTARLVPGFLVTDHLEFEERTAEDGDVTFVGFVAPAKMTLPLSVVKNGVNFYSVRSPMGVQIARAMHWLGGRNIACENVFNESGANPAWATHPSTRTVASMATCSPQYLLSNEVMRWTSAKPPCGRGADGATTVCTGEMYYRNLVKISETVEGLR